MSDETDVPTKKPKYVLLEVKADGSEVRQYESGDIRNERGQLLSLPPQLEPLITSENAHQYHAMRKAKILAAIESGIQDVTKTKAPADAIAAIVKKRAQVAMTDNTRTGNEAAKIVLAASDAYQTKSAENTQVTRHEYTVDDDTRQLLHAMMQERRDNHVTSSDDTSDGEILAENIE